MLEKPKYTESTAKCAAMPEIPGSCRAVCFRSATVRVEHVCTWSKCSEAGEWLHYQGVVFGMSVI